MDIVAAVPSDCRKLYAAVERDPIAVVIGFAELYDFALQKFDKPTGINFAALKRIHHGRMHGGAALSIKDVVKTIKCAALVIMWLFGTLAARYVVYRVAEYWYQEDASHNNILMNAYTNLLQISNAPGLSMEQRVQQLLSIEKTVNALTAVSAISALKWLKKKYFPAASQACPLLKKSPRAKTPLSLEPATSRGKTPARQRSAPSTAASRGNTPARQRSAPSTAASRGNTPARQSKKTHASNTSSRSASAKR